jgi:lipopolysaccharide/colanic/teichoic acid biosynthesis glycosyltransferase
MTGSQIASHAATTPGEVLMEPNLSIGPYFRLKRVVDVVLSLLGLLVSLPVLGAVALTVKATSRGPVLYRQERIGRHCEPFLLLKFRTMRQGSDREGPLVTWLGDARVTAVGRFLRKYKLDELPQLWNVLVGDMSLVGPRPQTVKYFESHRDDYARVLGLVRPGVTDYATIKYRDEEAIVASLADPEKEYVEKIIPDKLRLHHLYLSRISLGTDLSILLQTMLAIVPAAGQRQTVELDPAWMTDRRNARASRTPLR